jgi:hypothetical protein
MAGAALVTHAWLTRIIQDQNTLAQALTLALAISAGLAVLAIAGRLLRIPEFDEAVSSARAGTEVARPLREPLWRDTIRF